MEIEITYPKKSALKLQRHNIIRLARWPFLFAAYICPIINLLTGGPAWSVVVVWGLWIVWSFSLSPGLVEINRISLFVKFLANAAMLLIIIDVFLSPGWAIEVVPIVCFAGLTVTGVLLFTDIDRQKQNMMPMLLFIVVSLASSVSGLIIWGQDGDRWALGVMGAFAFALLIAGVSVLGNDFLLEVKKRFHTE